MKKKELKCILVGMYLKELADNSSEGIVDDIDVEMAFKKAENVVKLMTDHEDREWAKKRSGMW